LSRRASRHAETLALHTTGAAAAATVVRGLPDDQRAASGTALPGDDLSSIKKTIRA
jgi:hypothetical protein